MADDRRIYRVGTRWKTILLTALIVLAVLLAIVLGLFFGFRRYIVYTSDGVKLEVPWLEETVSAQQEQH